jgi:hypothetical protein
MGWTTQDTSGDADFDDEDVQIPVGYYWGRITNARVYENDSGKRLAISFAVDHEDDEVEVPFFLPAKVSHYDSDELSDSGLVEQFEGVGLGEALFRALGKDGMEDGARFVPENDDEAEQLETAIEAIGKGKEFKIDVNDLGDDASVVDKVADYRDAE